MLDMLRDSRRTNNHDTTKSNSDNYSSGNINEHGEFHNNRRELVGNCDDEGIVGYWE